MLVENLSNGEEKGALGLAPRKFLGPRPLERRKMHLSRTEYSAGFQRFGCVTLHILPKFTPLLPL